MSDTGEDVRAGRLDWRWEKISTLFGEVVDLPQAERERRLAEAAGADPELRREVESLLTADAPASVLFPSPRPTSSPRTSSAIWRAVRSRPIRPRSSIPLANTCGGTVGPPRPAPPSLSSP